MKLLTLAKASLILYASATTTSAFAQDGDNEVTYISPSIIMIGTPDPCYNGACEEEAIVIEAKTDSNAPLVDANGMATSMPVIMRPSVETATSNTTSSQSAPIAAPAAAEQPTPAPSTSTEVTSAPATPIPPNAAPTSDAREDMN